MAKAATGMVIVPPRMVLVTPAMVRELTEDLRTELPGYQFRIVNDYVGRLSHDYFVEADGEVPNAAIERLQAILARYGDSSKTRPR